MDAIPLPDFIVVSNDETDMTFAEIADAAESSYRSYHNI